MKKTLRKIVAAILCLTAVFALPACETEAPQIETQTTVSFCSASRTVLREEKYSASGEFTLNTFRGDVEAGQLIINPARDVAKFNFAVGDLTREGGNEKLTADKFDVFAERYIEVLQSTSGNTDIGWYADALIPIKNYAAKRENKITKGNNQGIWINLNVPADAVPGTYKGTGVLTLDEEKIEVPMTVTVYDIDMPDEVHAVTCYWLDVAMIPVGEGKPATEELVNTYYEFALSKRVSPMTIPGFMGAGQRFDATEYAEGVVPYAKDGRVSCYALPYTGDGQGVVSQSYCEEILTALAVKNVELRQAGDGEVDLFKKAIFYFGSLIDEPTNETYPKVRECDLRVQKAKMKIAASEILADYPDLRESVLKVNHVVTTKIRDILYGTDEVGGVQTWCPTIDHFSGAKARALAIERKNSTDRTGGEDVWWYTCINPKNPYPTYHLDDNYLTMRLLKWMQYDYKISGNIFWSINYWKKFKFSVTSECDIWTEANNYEGCNEDGKLTYPGSKYGVNGPISTLRLEGLRESSEDYEILWLAEQGINAINAEYGKSYNPDEILENFYSRLFTNMFLKEGVETVQFERIRCELLTLVQKLYHDKAGAIGLLDNYNNK